jgi:hypothetical protein
MARPYKKMAQMYLGSYAVTWFGEPPHNHPLVAHDTNLEDTDEIRMQGFAVWHAGTCRFMQQRTDCILRLGAGARSQSGKSLIS